MTARLFRCRHAPPAVVSAILAACSRSSPPIQAASVTTEDTAAKRAAAAAVPDFANKIWKVVKSSAVDTGALYVFLSDGSMLISSAHGTPAIGSWHLSGETLTLTEEGLPHPAAVVRQSPDTLGVRVAGPGAPVDITFVPGVKP